MMEKAKKIKIFIGLFYVISVGLFLYLIFSKFSINEIVSYEFIKNNQNYFFELRKSNLIVLASIFILFTIIWILALGFLSPLGLFAGFIFGKFFWNNFFDTWNSDRCNFIIFICQLFPEGYDKR